jgi:hypothetical protein
MSFLQYEIDEACPVLLHPDWEYYVHYIMFHIYAL